MKYVSNDQEVERQAYDGAKTAAEQAGATDSGGQGRWICGERG
jgi:hypothetical protein